MKSEIEFLQGAFESYKSTLHQEMNDEFNKKVEKLKSEHDDEMEKQLQELSKCKSPHTSCPLWSYEILIIL
jgi:hypothetical protein